MPAKLLGKTQPRLHTPPLRRLTQYTTLGYEVANFAEAIGEPLLPWQRWLAIHALELNRDGSPRFRVIVVLVARQNGKSSVKRIISLYRLYIRSAKLVLGVAQDVSLAREQWNYSLDTIYACPHLAGELDQVRRVNGDEWFRLHTELGLTDDRELEYDDDDGDESWTLAGGGRYKIAATNRKAGRGLSIDELNFDELREQRNWQAWSALYHTTLARPDAQIWAMSNAGDDESVVLNQLRDTALSGRDPTIGLFEWSAADDCELDDVRQIAQANPGLGYTISLPAITTARAIDPPAIYRTEVLCQRVEQLDGAVDYQAWQACADTGTMDAHKGRIALCFDMAPDGAHCTLAAAALLDDGRPRTEIVKAWKSSDEARAELPALIERIQAAALAWYPTGPAAGLATVLRPAALKANHRPGKRNPLWMPEHGEITGARVAEVCQELADRVRARGILHSADPLLDAHIRGASKLPSGDGWRFTRRGGGHADAAYACAGAINAALTMPPLRRARLRFIS